jgi:hypothetical protein
MTIAHKAHINLTIDPSVIRWIDTIRGQEPRSTFINRVLALICSKSQKTFNWEKEEEKADRDIRKNRVHKFTSAEEAIKWLNI